MEVAARQVQTHPLVEARRQFVKDLRAEHTKDGTMEEEEAQERTPQQEDEEKHFRASRRGQALARLARLKP